MRFIVGLVFVLWLSLSDAGERHLLPGNSNGLLAKEPYFPRHRRQTLINRSRGKKVGVPARGLSPRRDDCLEGCTCRRVREIRCMLKSLTEIPQDLPGSMEKINFAVNKIREITPESFASHNDTLRFLYLHSNDIRSLDNGVFSTLGKLQVLRLTWNKLSGIRKATFHGLQSLTRLYLDNNRLTFVHPLAFRDLVNLQFLQLDGNRLSKLHKDLFVTLEFQKYFRHSAIQYLYLTKNSFTHLPRGIFDQMNDLKAVFLHSNPWACSCEMKWLRDWMVTSRKSRCRKNSWRLTAATECAVCDWPLSLRGEEMENVPSENFTCSGSEEDGNSGEDYFNPDVIQTGNDLALIQHSNFYSTRMNIRLDSYRRSMLHASCNLTQIPTTKVVEIEGPRQDGAGEQMYTAEFTGEFDCFPEYPSNSESLAELLAVYFDREIQLTKREVKMANLGENTEIYSISVDGFTERPASPLTAASISSDSNFVLSKLSTVLVQREGIDSDTNTFSMTFRTSFTHKFYPKSLPEFSRVPWTLIRQPRPVPLQVVITLEQEITASKCKAVGQPRSAITWVSPSGEALRSGERNENFAVSRSGRLYFRRPTPEDSGVFHCIASIPDPDNADSDLVAEVAALSLQVFERTDDAEYPDPAAQYLLKNVAEGETWSSECDLELISNATVGWITPDNHLLPVESESRLGRVSTNQDGGITVTDFQKSDQGLYRCVAASIAGKSEYSVFVSILSDEVDDAIEEVVFMDYDPDSTEYDDPMETPGINEPHSPSISDIEKPKPTISRASNDDVSEPVTTGKVERHSTAPLTTTTTSTSSTTTLGNMEPVIPEIIIPISPDMVDEGEFEDSINSSILDTPEPVVNLETGKPVFESSTAIFLPATSSEASNMTQNPDARDSRESSDTNKDVNLESSNTGPNSTTAFHNKTASNEVEAQSEVNAPGVSIKVEQPDIINVTSEQTLVSGNNTTAPVNLDKNVEQPEIIKVTESLPSTSFTSALTEADRHNVAQPDLSTDVASNDTDKGAITDNMTREATSPELPELVDVHDTPVPSPGVVSHKYNDFLATPTGFERIPIKATAVSRTHRPNWNISSQTLSSQTDGVTDTRTDGLVKPPSPEPTTNRPKQDILILEHDLDDETDIRIEFQAETPDLDSNFLQLQGRPDGTLGPPTLPQTNSSEISIHPGINGGSDAKEDDEVLLNGHGNATEKHAVLRETNSSVISRLPDRDGGSDEQEDDEVLLNGHDNATDKHAVLRQTNSSVISRHPEINGGSDAQEDDDIALLNGHDNATDRHATLQISEGLNGNSSIDTDLNGDSTDRQTHIQHGFDSTNYNVTLLDEQTDESLLDLDDDLDTQTQGHPDTTTRPKTIDELMSEHHNSSVFANKTVITAFVRMEKDNDTKMTSSISDHDVIDHIDVDPPSSNIRRPPRRRVTSSHDFEDGKHHRTVIIPAMRVPTRHVVEVPAKRVPANVVTKSIQGLEHKRIALPCISVTGYYPPGSWSFTWKLPNGEEYNRPNRIFSRDWSKYIHRNSSLLLRSLEKTDSGLYACTAIDEVKQKEYHVQIQLDVTMHGPRINNPEREYVRLRAGDPLFLPCSVSGIPKPVSHWETPWGTKIYFAMILDRIEVFENGTLYIPDVRHDERGAYRCVAKSPSGSAARLVTVTVLMFAPRFLDHPFRTERIGRGESIHLSCRATGYPEPKKYWLLPNGRKINTNHAMFRSTRHQPKHVVMKNGELILNRADWNDIGRYHCVIANHLGRSASTILLLVTH